MMMIKLQLLVSAVVTIPSLHTSLPTSGTNEVLNLTKISNVNIPGVWMFQADNHYGKERDEILFLWEEGGRGDR